MSQENVETVEAIFRGWNERGLDGMLPLFAPDIEYLPIEERGIVYGHEGMRRYFDRWMESWEELKISPSEVTDAGDRVFNGAKIDGRGRASGLEVTMEYWQVWTFQKGKAIRWEEYLDRQEALEAAGLSE